MGQRSPPRSRLARSDVGMAMSTFQRTSPRRLRNSSWSSSRTAKAFENRLDLRPSSALVTAVAGHTIPGIQMTPNKSTVDRYMDGFRKSDHAQILSCLTDDVEWEIPGAFHIRG